MEHRLQPSDCPDLDTQEWAETDDPDRAATSSACLTTACAGSPGRSTFVTTNAGLLLLPATPDLTRSLTYRSLQQKASRDVFAVYHKKSDPEAVSHFRHSAFSGSFQRYGREWYLQITPTYLYTVDGYRLSRFQGDCSPASSGSTATRPWWAKSSMWGDYLTPEQRRPLRSTRLSVPAFGKLERFQVNRVIDDAAWLSQDSTAPEQEGGEAEEWPLPDEP